MEKNIQFLDIPVRIAASEIKHKPLHYHPDVLELVFVVEGRIAVTSKLNSTFVEQGGFFVVNPGCLHSIHSNQIGTVVSLYFDLASYVERYPHIRGIDFFEVPQREVARQEDSWRELRNYFIRLMLMHNKNTVRAREIMRDLSDKMMALLWQFAQRRKELPVKLRERYYRISTYLWNHYREDLTVEQVASVEDISVTRLAHFWKDTTGRSIRQSFTRIKLDEAERLLLSTTMTINDIVHHCGFSDEKYFYQHFKAYYTVTPKEYRLFYLNREQRTERAMLSRREFEQRFQQFTRRYYKTGIEPSVEGQSQEELDKEAVLEHVYNAMLANPQMLSRQVESTGQQVSLMNIAPSKALSVRDGEYQINWEYVYAMMQIFLDQGMESNVVIEYDCMEDSGWEKLLSELLEELTVIWGKKVIESQRYLICSQKVDTYQRCMGLAHFLQEKTPVKHADAMIVF